MIYRKDGQVVNNNSLEYWRRAADRPLHWAPDLSFDECEADKQWKLGPDFLKKYQKIMMSRDLQKKLDAQKIIEAQREVEFEATKAHLAALNTDRKRKVEDAKMSPLPQDSNPRENRISEYKLEEKEEKEDVVADTRELAPDLQASMIKKDTKGDTESQSAVRKVSETSKASIDESEPIEQQESKSIEDAPRAKPQTTEPKVVENVGQSVVHQIQQFQLMGPRQP